MYFSKAIVIEGAFGDGARYRFLNHCQSFFCVSSKTGYSGFVLFNSGFLNKDLIPVGLKKGQ
jgi:hypothetical protein